MGIHKLTEQKAKLLDDVLRFMLNVNRDRGTTVHFDFGTFVLNRYLDGDNTVLQDNIETSFSIADNYLKNGPKPYVRTGGKLYTNSYTDIFLNEGGFLSIWEEDNIKERYIDQLRTSTLSTNNWMRWLTFTLAIIALLTFIIEVYKSCKDEQICKSINQQQKSLKDKTDSIYNDSSYQMPVYNKNSLQKEIGDSVLKK